MVRGKMNYIDEPKEIKVKSNTIPDTIPLPL